MIIIIVVLVKKRDNKRDNAKTLKQDKYNILWESTVNKPDTHENTTIQHSKPWAPTVNKPDYHQQAITSSAGSHYNSLDRLIQKRKQQ